MSGMQPAAVVENRRRLRIAAELPAEPAWLAQVHGTRCWIWTLPAGAAEHWARGHWAAEPAARRTRP